jgi:hypothetical protein
MDKKYNTLLAGLMCIALSACGTMDRGSVVDAGEIRSGELYGETAGNVGLVTGPAIAGSRPSGSSSMSGTSSASGMSGSSEMPGAAEASGASGTSDSYGTSGSAGMPGPSSSSGESAASDTASPAASPSMSSGSADMSQSSAMTSYGVIQSIDALPRTEAFGPTAGAPMAGSTSGGSGAMTGSGAPGDMVYRVTMRMDDGSTRALIQESRPGFQTGDRVRMASNMLQRY